MLKVHALHYLLTDISFMETFLCLLPKLLSGLCWNAKFLWSCSIADIVVLQHPKHLFITIFSLSQHLLALTYVIYSIPSEFWKSTVMSSKYKVIFATKARLTDQPNIFYNLFDLWSEKQKKEKQCRSKLSYSVLKEACSLHVHNQYQTCIIHFYQQTCGILKCDSFYLYRTTYEELKIHHTVVMTTEDQSCRNSTAIMTVSTYMRK